ncbi:opine metallophore biosynthesis dehydrogenase [Paenibacillus chitinolyticus]|uniref:opine metallophore biosynthesis dehydrogenase n=1 Tax=Paenibacillus chitinolyticus TaxID=79263 RepID=UPI002DC048DF|nr:opine metallophore biosynthesis dehydrogenase [Paenibacillus chitinolyticus]MEC0249196.1 opine metallophore biosynthesis dehydrogenase [Paenibacillus chitinolyticus]
MGDFQRVLVLGTGPASIQLAVLLKKVANCRVGIAGRKSVRSEHFFAALKQSSRRIRADIQNEKHRQLQGECVMDDVFHGYESIAGSWDTVILSVTADAYIGVLQQIREQLLQQVRCVVLISPTFGSNSLIRHYMTDIRADAEIISFSTYLGDTRWRHGKPSDQVITTGIKKKVFIGSTKSPSDHVTKLRTLYEQLGITLEIMRSPFEAETRNSSLYVHPPLFMNDFSLNVLFGEAAPKKFVYKMFPEGPITPGLIRDMVACWKEMTAIIRKLNIEGLNLLKFMTDDNYPVRPESLSRHEIDNFLHFETIHQEYLVYVRYTSLLIDPFSEPDQDGRYFDFSAVPIRQIFVNQEGYWDIPRMPKEDYYRIKIIQGIARYVDSSCPTIDTFIATYERRIEEAARHKLKDELLSDAFTVQSFEEDLKRIRSEIETRLGSKKNELEETT